ncbi:MAG: hypothetical protein WD872_05980 [Pirellulaceae bacterium]
MKWTGMAALAMLALAAASVAHAVEPQSAGIRMQNPRGPLQSAATWWTRFGEPTNAEAIAPVPAESQIAPVGWNNHGFGYVYGPGSCDHTPACTDWQWNDYNPMPWRCLPLHARRGHGCNSCGRGHVGLFNKQADCGCAAPAPACGIEKMPACGVEPPACGCDATPKCGKRHFHWHWKRLGLFNKQGGCDTCTTAAPACGCEAPACGYDAPAYEYSPPQYDEAPKPLPEDSVKANSAAASHMQPSLVWPFGGPVR